jgi:hypothetical protein
MVQKFETSRSTLFLVYLLHLIHRANLFNGDSLFRKSYTKQELLSMKSQTCYRFEQSVVEWLHSEPCPLIYRKKHVRFICLLVKLPKKQYTSDQEQEETEFGQFCLPVDGR